MFTSLIPMVGPGFHHGPPLFFLGGPIMCLIVLALVIGAIILAKQGKLGPPPWVRHGGHGPQGWHHGPGQHGPGPGHGPGPHDGGPTPEGRAYTILAERLASGDITPDEYRERVAVLRETSAPPADPTWPPNPSDPHPDDQR